MQPAEFPHTERKFLRFETLTLAPFDRRLIVPGMLPHDHVAWLDAYHARVRRLVGALLQPAEDAATLTWLAAATAPLQKDLAVDQP